MKNIIAFFIVLGLFQPVFSQDIEDSLFVRNIFNEALDSYVAYNQLIQLCTIAPGRLAGTDECAIAQDFMYNEMKAMPFDTVYKQPVWVRKWLQNGEETAYFDIGDGQKQYLAVDALGGSVATPEDGIETEIVVVKTMDELQTLGREKIEGKIVFFDFDMNQHNIYTFSSYGENVGMRVYGADEASKYGAVAVLVRSLTLAQDTFPHTGIMRYKTGSKKIPGIGISAIHSDLLAQSYVENPHLKVYLHCACKEYPGVKQYNIIGEIKGSKYPNRIISIGGHIDAWFNTQGANDDGGGCIQSLEVARLFFALNYKPENTIRIVMFLDEEMAQRGARAYADNPINEGEQHYFALESDRGVTYPTGFSFDGSDAFVKKMQSWASIFEPYGLHRFEKAGSGVDVSFLKVKGCALAALVTESQRYFDFHHSANDTWKQVNRREMQMGSAAMTALIYLVDKYGLY